MKLCKHDEHHEATTFGDTAKGLKRFVCAVCGARYTEPFDWIADGEAAWESSRSEWVRRDFISPLRP